MDDAPGVVTWMLLRASDLGANLVNGHVIASLLENKKDVPWTVNRNRWVDHFVYPWLDNLKDTFIVARLQRICVLWAITIAFLLSFYINPYPPFPGSKVAVVLLLLVASPEF
jgi:hypothetical protein